MKKFIILFIFIASYAQEPDDVLVVRQKQDAEILYNGLLRYRARDIHFEECSPLPWNWWRLDTIPNTIDDVDSVTAIAIAIRAAEKCYGDGVTPIAARLMGDNKEHWMVYIYIQQKRTTMF